VTLFLLAADNHVINGAELLQATVHTGMQFGDMNIFHRLPEGSEKPIFSMANAAKPGYFERDEWNTFETSGVVLFLTLPAPVNALDAWDAMLATGRRMAEILHAELLDEERKPFTRQREAEVREEMRNYERQQS
jgi:cell division protein ZipA